MHDNIGMMEPIYRHSAQKLKRKQRKTKKKIPFLPLLMNDNNIIIINSNPLVDIKHKISNSSIIINDIVIVNEINNPIVKLKEINSTFPFEEPTVTMVDNITNNHNFNNLSRNDGISKLINYLISCNKFSLLHVKRSMDNFLLATNNIQKHIIGERIKPRGLYIDEMWDPFVCIPGDDELPHNSHTLNVTAMDQFHIETCTYCNAHRSIQESCYFAQLRKCITHGWNPPIDTDNSINQKYRTDRNYPACSLYPVNLDKEIKTLFDFGVLCQVPKEELLSGPSIISPLGMKIKTSDLNRARVLVGIDVKNQDQMLEANRKLSEQQQPPIKPRIITDFTASGGNDACYTPCFFYPGIKDAIHMIEHNDYLCKGDASKYYLNFPLAEVCRWIFRIQILAAILEYLRVFFGLSCAPFYASTWSAEFRSWIVKMGIPCIVMMDDWLTKGKTSLIANTRMDRIESTLLACGLSMDASKRDCSQIIVYLGIELNTISMTMKIDKIQCHNVKSEMESCLKKLINHQYISAIQICHISGTLNWYNSEIIQSGRIHSRYWWNYMRTGNHLTAYKRHKLIIDTKWWIELLSIWSNNLYSGNKYKMFTASEIQNPQQIYVLQSDSSGTDGFGYHGGFLGDPECSQQFVSRRWLPHMFTECNKISAEYNSASQLFSDGFLGRENSPNSVIFSASEKTKNVLFSGNSGTSFCPEKKLAVTTKNSPTKISAGTMPLSAIAAIFHPEKNAVTVVTPFIPTDPVQLPQSSIWGEIYALKDFLQTTRIENKIFVWVSDSLDAVYDINKGRCGSEQDAELLRAIFFYCDKKRLQIIAILVPRELNIMADYLSHLSYMSDRDSICGNVADLERPDISC